MDLVETAGAAFEPETGHTVLKGGYWHAVSSAVQNQWKVQDTRNGPEVSVELQPGRGIFVDRRSNGGSAPTLIHKSDDLVQGVAQRVMHPAGGSWFNLGLATQRHFNNRADAFSKARYPVTTALSLFPSLYFLWRRSAAGENMAYDTYKNFTDHPVTLKFRLASGVSGIPVNMELGKKRGTDTHLMTAEKGSVLMGDLGPDGRVPYIAPQNRFLNIASGFIGWFNKASLIKGGAQEVEGNGVIVLGKQDANLRYNAATAEDDPQYVPSRVVAFGSDNIRGAGFELGHKIVDQTAAEWRFDHNAAYVITDDRDEHELKAA